jgi:type IV pilus assembly protein PilE
MRSSFTSTHGARRRLAAGFTLIELMIGVAIVAILAAVALPSYQSYVLKSRRADALALLQSVQLAQEKHRLSNWQYFDRCPAGVSCTSQHYVVEEPIPRSPTGFTLTAKPRAGSPQAKDTACKEIVLKQTAANGVEKSGTSADCWRS